MTAAELLAALRAAGCRPAVEGDELVLDEPVPAPLAAHLEALHTGVRAALTGRRWAGYDPADGRPRWLSPADRLPPRIRCLAVEGDRTWDRLRRPPPG
jgi:hypothetical protein